MKRLVIAGLAALTVILTSCGSAGADPAVCGLIEDGTKKYSSLPTGWAYAYSVSEVQKADDLTHQEANERVETSVHEFCPRYIYLENAYYGRSS